MEYPETVEYTTPGGRKLVLRGYLTGRMKQRIENALASAAKADGDEITFAEDATSKATNAAIEVAVISVDGQTEGLLDLILDMREDEYDLIKAEVDKVTTPLAKRTSLASETATNPTSEVESSTVSIPD